MLVPRALITAALASAAALTVAGCGSDPKSDDTAQVAGSTPAAVAAGATPSAATDTPAATPTTCPFEGADVAAKLISGAKPTSLSASSCTYANPSDAKETVTLTFAAKADLTVGPGDKYPVIYTVYQNNYKSEPKAHYKAISVGETGYSNSQTTPFPTAAASWIQDGNYWALKHQYFKKSESTRKTETAAVIKAAKSISAKN